MRNSPVHELTMWPLFADTWPLWMDDACAAQRDESAEAFEETLRLLNRGPLYARSVTHEHTAELSCEEAAIAAAERYYRRRH